MANTLFGGFRVVACNTTRARRYEVASGYSTALFAGDFTTLVTAGTVTASTAGDAALLLGPIKEFEYTLAGKRIRDTYLPASTTYSPTSRGSRNASYVWVYDDPNAEYLVCMASHADTDTEAETWAGVGANMDLVATAGSTVYRRSGYTLDGDLVAATAQFRILEVHRIPGRTLGSANLIVRCCINEGFHAFFSSAGI